MEGHDLEEYGAVEGSAVQSSKRSIRSYVVTATICITMVAALALLASNWQRAPIEDIVISPDDKLERLVHTFAEHGSTLSLSEMEKKLADWRHEASTILDANENHMQVYF